MFYYSSSLSTVEVPMSYSILPMTQSSDCESILEETNAFIEFAYTEANAVARRAHIYEYSLDLEALRLSNPLPGLAGN